MAEEPTPLRALLTYRAQPGRVTWLGVREKRRVPMRALEQVELLTDRGLRDDYASARSAGRRQVSLIQAEHLPVIATLCGRTGVLPEQLRRNLVVSGINLLALRGRPFRIGAALLQGVGLCEPCSKMETELGHGGYNAMRGHGGILARVIEGAIIRIGDTVDFAEATSEP